MKTRFFYAAPIYDTWPKLFVLTENGKFYCEYLNFMRPDTIDHTVDFNAFKASDYKFGDYQTIEEVDEATAKKTQLTRQMNWIQKYLDKL